MGKYVENRIDERKTVSTAAITQVLWCNNYLTVYVYVAFIYSAYLHFRFNLQFFIFSFNTALQMNANTYAMWISLSKSCVQYIIHAAE